MYELFKIWVKGKYITESTLYPLELSALHRGLITRHFTFYKLLSEADKRRFEHRVKKFIDKHEFVGRDGVKVTEKMRILISSTAIMLTFGMSRYLLSEFDTIIIYPKDYFSQVTKQQHKGETNPKYRTIVFSWDDFMEGIKVENDNLNLGIHELTHALHFTFKRRKSVTAINFMKRFKQLLNILKDRKLQRKIVASGYLRSYGFRNEYEFLAVLVEHFFETPEEFNEKLPEVYKMVRLMLNLDILKMTARASQGVVLPK